MVYTLTSATEIVAPKFEGVHIHDPSDPSGTDWNFRFGSLDRGDDLDVASAEMQFEGRTYPVFDFGHAQAQAVSMTVTVPFEEQAVWRAGVNRMLKFAQIRKTLCYRDGRGRRVFGVITGCGQSDVREGTEFKISIRRVNYSEGETLPVAVPVLSQFDFTYTRLNSPSRTLVSDSQGWAATFTDNSHTVLLRGPARTFTEQIAPFKDEFTRNDTSSWGTAPRGGSWQNSGGSAVDYNVASTGSTGTGSITVTSTGVARRVTVNNNNIGDVDLKVSITTDKVVTGTGDYIGGLLFGFAGTANYYHPRLSFKPDGSVTVSIQQRTSDVDTTAAAAVTKGIAGSYAANQKWWLRGQLTTGGIIRCRAWKSGTTEPSTWDCSFGDTTFVAGKVGVRAICNTNTGTSSLPIKFTFDDFELINGSWIAPSIPVVHDNRYVHLLDLPFNGSVDTDWLRAKLIEPEDDILKIAFQYAANAPALIDGGGIQYAGDAEYGPLYNTDRSFDLTHASDGTRQEGSDYNDYLGITVTYDNGDVDAPETHQFRSLDCSGFVRMVYGYRGGLALTTDTPLDGTAIPRVSLQIAAFGPGIIVVSGAPPSLLAVQPGDIVSFDADQSNPDENEGQIDHVGIVIGVDIYGHIRFISARKTVSGPTISDVGGSSILDLTGLYARTARTVRRF